MIPITTICYYSPVFYLYAEIWASVKEYSLKCETEAKWTFKQTRKWAWLCTVAKQGQRTGWERSVHAREGAPTSPFSTVIPAELQAPPRTLKVLWATWVAKSVRRLVSDVKPYVHLFFMDLSSAKLNVNFFHYLTFQNTEAILECWHFLYRWARLPLNLVLSYHRYVTGVCGHQRKCSQV